MELWRQEMKVTPRDLLCDLKTGKCQKKEAKGTLGGIWIWVEGYVALGDHKIDN